MLFFTPIEAVVPMRSTASEAAEQVSQLLYGEIAESHLPQEGNWQYIRCLHDGYEGWVDAKMIREISAEQADTFRTWQPNTHRNYSIPQADGSPLWLPIGARISTESTAYFSVEEMLAFGRTLLNTPYLWGGRSSFGIDCSGLMQILFAMRGILLPRDASQQGKVGQEIPFAEIAAGDVVFCSKPGKTNISHVGVLLAPDQILHASGRVRIDFLTENGVIHSQNQQLTHSLVYIRRFSPV